MPAGITTPLRADTFRHMISDAGAFLTEFDPSEYTTIAALKAAIVAAINEGKTLGATINGGSFVLTREMRQREADGKRFRFVGDTSVDSGDPYLSTTLKELGDPKVLKAAMGTAEMETSGQKTMIQVKTRIEESDYLTDLTWIGDITNMGYCVIHFPFAFNTADLNITFTDKGDATMPVEFHAFQGSVEDYDYMPFDMIILEPTATFTAVESPTGNPRHKRYYERTGESADDYVYFLTRDDTVVSGKTYYTATYSTGA